MSGSIAAAAKARLVGESGVLAGLSGMTGVTVTYTLPLNSIPREVVFAGKIGGQMELAAMKAGGRIKRAEELNMQLFVRVYEPGHRTTEVTDARAIAISTLIENYLAATPRLGGTPAGLKGCYVRATDLDGWVDDEGAGSVRQLTIGFMSFLD